MICVLRSLIVMLGREAANLYLFVKRNLEMKSNSNLISMDKRIQLGSQHRVTTSMKLPDEVVLLPQTCHVINAQTVKRWHLFSHHGMVGNSRVWQFSEKRVTAMRIMACLSFVGSSLLNSFSSKTKGLRVVKVVDKLKRFKWKSKIPVNLSWSLLCTYFCKVVFIPCVSSVLV